MIFLYPIFKNVMFFVIPGRMKSEDIALPDGQPDVGPRKVTEDEML